MGGVSLSVGWLSPAHRTVSEVSEDRHSDTEASVQNTCFRSFPSEQERGSTHKNTQVGGIWRC